mgnify:CR=1 FL=1
MLALDKSSLNILRETNGEPDEQLLIWFAIGFTENVERGFVEGKHGDKVDATTAAAVAKLLRAAIIISGALMALQTFGFSISGVLALGGVGGIAIGFCLLYTSDAADE